MVALFARLKLQLLRSGLRASGQRVFAFAVGLVFGIAAAAFGFLTLAGLDHRRDARIVTLMFAGVALGWVALPVFAFAVDELLDPSRLALFPLTDRQLLLGLLAAGLIGVPPIATLIGLSGALAAFTHGALSWLLVAAAVVVHLLLCVALSRAVTTGLSGLLRSRRGRDVTAVLLGAFGGGIGLAAPVLVTAASRLDSTVGHAVYVLSRYSALGSAGAAVGAAGSGRYGAAAGQLALAVLYLAVLLLWWRTGLRRAMTTAEATRRRRSSDSAGDLRPRWVRRLLPVSGVGAIAAKDLRYQWRDPLRRTALLATVGPASAVVFSAMAAGSREPRTVLLAMIAATMMSLSALNQFGLDGAAHWMNAMAGPDPRRDLLGKNLAAAIVALSVTGVVATLAAAITGGWVYVPVALAGGIAGCGGTLGVANVVSVRAPAAQAESATNAWAGGGGGQSMSAGIKQFGSLLVVAVILLPLGLFIGGSALLWTPGLFVAVPLSIGYGVLLWSLGLRYAVRWVWWRQPELLAAISPRRAA